MPRFVRLALVSCLALIALWPATAQADLPARWTFRARPVVASALLMLGPRPDTRWVGGIRLGDSVRSLLLRSPAALQRLPLRGHLPSLSVPLVPLMVKPSGAQPVVMDWSEKAPVAHHSVVGLQALSYTGLVSFTTLRLSSSPECRRTRDAKDCMVDMMSFSGPPTNSSGAVGGATRGASDRNPTSDPLTGLIPPLLRYSNDETKTNVSVSIQPGGPCTGACLKVAGSF